jgi:hypothetical protein
LWHPSSLLFPNSHLQLAGIQENQIERGPSFFLLSSYLGPPAAIQALSLLLSKYFFFCVPDTACLCMLTGGGGVGFKNDDSSKSVGFFQCIPFTLAGIHVNIRKPLAAACKVICNCKTSKCAFAAHTTFKYAKQQSIPPPPPIPPD